ncbi:MAG: 2Fe-2S iron-sulfur cluster-binding protein [Pseudomonadota bacterium]
MAKITYIEHNGTEHQAEVPSGQSVKDGAINNLIPGILAECGGCCACATCHVYVDDAWRETVGEPDELESELLEFANEPKDNSRLSCQIEVSESLDGLIVRLPESQ